MSSQSIPPSSWNINLMAVVGQVAVFFFPICTTDMAWKNKPLPAQRGDVVYTMTQTILYPQKVRTFDILPIINSCICHLSVERK